MTLEEATKLVKECSKCKYVKVSEYVDAYLFETEDDENHIDGGSNTAVVLKHTGEVVNLSSYILNTYRDLEEELISEYDVSESFLLKEM